MQNLNIEDWLESHSTGVSRIGNEMHFTHFTGEASVLVERSPGVSVEYPKNDHLLGFYKSYVGASIGSTMLMLASSIPGGLVLSTGVAIPDFRQLASAMAHSGCALPEGEDAFMVGSAGMFYFTYPRLSGGPVLKCYDRDTGTVYVDRSFVEVLNDWWQLLLDDA